MGEAARADWIPEGGGYQNPMAKAQQEWLAKKKDVNYSQTAKTLAHFRDQLMAGPRAMGRAFSGEMDPTSQEGVGEALGIAAQTVGLKSAFPTVNSLGTGGGRMLQPSYPRAGRVEGLVPPAPREFAPLRGPQESDPAFVYHATNTDRAQDIAGEGLRRHLPHEFTDQATWPDGSRQKRNYFTPTAQNTWQFAPEEGTPTLLRARGDSHPFQRENGTGDLYSTKDVPPAKLEYNTPDKTWRPLWEPPTMPAHEPPSGVNSFVPGEAPSTPANSNVPPAVAGGAAAATQFVPGDANAMDLPSDRHDPRPGRVQGEGGGGGFVPKPTTTHEGPTSAWYPPQSEATSRYAPNAPFMATERMTVPEADTAPKQEGLQRVLQGIWSKSARDQGFGGKYIDKP